MKRLLLVAPLGLFLLLHACLSVPAVIPPAIGTAVAQTQTAVMWTPTITPIPNPDEQMLVQWLNEVLTAADPLEQALDASSQVEDIAFPPITDTASLRLVVRVRCTCARDLDCCSLERMFVLTINAMKKKAGKVLDQVPPNVAEVWIVCHNHGTEIGVMNAWWGDVKDYLLDNINANMLSSRVFPITASEW